MVVWGGNDRVTFPYTNTGGRYDPATNTWAPTSLTGAPSGRAYHSVAAAGSRMIVWGGAGVYPISLNTGAVYDPAADTWVPRGRASPRPRGGASTSRSGRERSSSSGAGRATAACEGMARPITRRPTPGSRRARPAPPPPGRDTPPSGAAPPCSCGVGWTRTATRSGAAGTTPRRCLERDHVLAGALPHRSHRGLDGLAHDRVGRERRVRQPRHRRALRSGHGRVDAGGEPVRAPRPGSVTPPCGRGRPWWSGEG
jgi:hypothetical protein